LQSAIIFLVGATLPMPFLGDFAMTSRIFVTVAVVNFENVKSESFSLPVEKNDFYSGALETCWYVKHLARSFENAGFQYATITASVNGSVCAGLITDYLDLEQYESFFSDVMN
jgi:hypothetical protein